MQITRRSALAGTALAFGAGIGGLPYRSAKAQAANTIRIGVLTDMSGMYRDNTGPTSVACARQAVAEFGQRGFNVEVIEADHQNRPDVGVNLARQWYDQGVDVIIDVPTSSVGLAVNQIAREKNKAYINVGSATADLTGAQCSPNTVHWAYDTWMLAKSNGGATVRAGGDTWFFITADYAFGHALERDTANFVRASGGRVIGQVRTPFPGTTDFSSFLVQAQASRAKVIGLANAGADTQNCVKQAAEFGITRRGIKLASLLLFINDVHGLGLQTAQGLTCTETFYWDLNDRTRAFTQRVLPRTPNNYPNMIHAGCYSGTLHFLKAIADMGVAAAKASGVDIINRMKAMPTEDDAFGAGQVRPDGRRLIPSYLFEVKSPAESRGPWDYLKLVQTTPAAEAFRPLGEGGCALVRS
ncbi:ABC transporter substrate-binding protein [Roseomonas alkaliterrae]|uniref:Branched-chain amino acid transport system substrate-binding protein n=1 Tax=Neoroseomonas alkaliterrae TaxID=1452450 RepID=A0A840YAW6_9PROT|nr:ABC transporter substrate-binding protein [Neoroseomonas alkaliterrae]MBB5691123.1 branched-chain amino acid transport system substrate-binding protein [Neoroseomonas alkaliterrae]MBR0676077.1 ABC transporter substrate-binding protein [Neoroseomonas alkaliterrae]